MEKVLGQSHTVLGTFTRPNDSNPYTAGDVMTTNTAAGSAVIISFPGASREVGGTTAGALAGGGIIQGAVLVDSANQATKLDGELWLFDTAMVMDGDNAVFTPTDTELATLVGVIAFPSSGWKAGDATAGAGGNAICEVDNLGIAFNTVNSNTLYGVLVARNGYTPVANGVFTFRLKILD